MSKKNVICSYVREQFNNKEKLKELVKLFKNYNNKSYIARGFVDNFDKFNTFEEYFKDYKQRKYIKENSKPGGIEQYLINRINSNNTLYTIKGEKVKSLGEVKIANFLYTNGIDYTYEKIFDEKVNEDVTYKPDFTIEYQGRNIYIEYFGLSNCYNENNELIKKEIAKYNRIRKMKENYQEKNNNIFINLDYKSPDGDFIKTLEIELKNLNVQFQKRENEILKEKFKYVCYSNNREIEAKCRIKALEYLKEIYEYYQKYLKENHMIDYDDMINLSYKQIIKEVKNKYPELNYKYIIVDEYQDITFQRFLFVKRIVEYFNAKLISVGDDWQSIYSFAGSRLDLFNKFNELFINSNDNLYLSTTYRYGQELVDITSNFILENEEQSK